MTEKMLSRLSVAILMLSAIHTAHAVEATPATMIVVGTINAAAKVSPATNDIVLAKQDNGTVAGQGQVSSDGSSYMVTISKTSDFNGTKLTLQIKKSSNGAVYALTDGNNPFSFSGGFLPTQLTMNPSIGALISSGTTDGGGSGTGSGGTGGTGSGTGGTGSGTGGTIKKPNSFDANGDGSSDQSDIDFIKQELAHGNNTSSADINSDGIVNTRDVIDAIKMLRGPI